MFGVCTCASESVLGELCDECRDGYWGLSQGLPCIPCDCCTNGSNSHICDKVRDPEIEILYALYFCLSFRILVNVIVMKMLVVKRMASVVPALQDTLISHQMAAEVHINTLLTFHVHITSPIYSLTFQCCMYAIECGCSELSASEECDIVTGQCQCEEGAVGTKCDDCAFGFTGIENTA